jgi:hypothetical protein
MHKIYLALVILALCGCRAKEPEKALVGEWPSEHVYKNQAFDLTISFPKDWVLKKGDPDGVTKKALDLTTSGTSESVKRGMEAAAAKTRPVFILTRYPVGTPRKRNITINAAVEDVSDKPGIASESDYLLVLEDTMKMTGLGVIFASEPHNVTFGKVLFSTREARIPMGGITLRQQYYAIKRGSHIFFLSTTTMAAEDDAEVLKVLESIQAL